MPNYTLNLKTFYLVSDYSKKYHKQILGLDKIRIDLKVELTSTDINLMTFLI